MANKGGGGGSSGIRAGRAFVELAAKDAGLSSTLAAMKRKVEGFGKATGRIGLAMAGMGGAGLAAGLTGVMDTLGDVAKMENAARALGMTSEAASGLFGMLAANGGDFKEDLEGITQFNQRIGDALNGVGGATGEAARLFEGLSVQAEDLIGLPLDEKFYKVIGAIRELPQEEQALRLSLMGGTDSMKKWLPLLSRSEEELRGMATASRMSAEDMKAARDANDAYTRATAALTQAWRQVAVALAPAIQQLAEQFVPVMKDLAGWVKDNRMLIIGLAAGLTAFTAAGLALAGVGLAVVGLTTALSALGAVIGVVFSPVGLGIAVIGTFLTVLAAAGEEVNESRSSITMLGDDFSTTWQSIKDAISAGDMEAAWRAMTDGLQVLWDDLTVGIVEGWHRAVTEIAVGIAKLMEVFTDLKRAKDFGISVMSMGWLRSADAGGESELVRAIQEDAERARKAREEERERNRRTMEGGASNNAANRILADNDRMMDKFINDMMRAIVTDKKVNEALAQTAGISRGTFRGAGAWQELSAAGGVLQKIETNTKKTAENTEGLAGALGVFA
jgi:hypothetical protein